MAYYIQRRVTLFATLLLLFSNILILAQLEENKTIVPLEGNKTTVHLDERSVASSSTCARLNTGTGGTTNWILFRARCRSLNTYMVVCFNTIHNDNPDDPPYDTLFPIPCPSQTDICFNILTPYAEEDGPHIRQDIICVPSKKLLVFKGDGTKSGSACSQPISGQIGAKQNWVTKFTRPEPYLKDCSRIGCVTSVKAAVIQTNMLNGQPTTSWTQLKSAYDSIDIEWNYVFQYTSEQIRVCFISGTIGIVYATIYNGLLVQG
jgi:hypothetical protein